MRWTSADKMLSIGGQKLSKVQAEIDADYKPRSQALGIDVELTSALVDESTDVPNVLAQLPGKTDEIIMLGAHFDHIGNDETGNCRAIVRRDTRDAICNGADDNASGTAMLLELARAYKKAGVTPERTIVFAHFSGEEIGLLGSRALMQHSPFDQSRVVAMVNLDMVGRLGPRGLAIGGIGSSADWMPLLDELGNYDMQILYEGSTTTRSDHAHWFRSQIPVLFFFTGVHGDYHRAGDEIDEINVEGLASIGQMVSDLIWELAGGRAIAWTAPTNGDGIGAGLPGSDPSTVIKRVAADGSPMLEQE
jgi:Zn-dependent M28 family amino/carboxypeptidase